MATYGPHNLRWLAGPNAADQLAALANPMSAAEGIIPELFGRTLDPDDLGAATGEIFQNLHPISTIWDHLGSMLEDYARPRFIQDMLANMDNAPMGKGRQVYDAGLNALLKLMKHSQTAGDSPEGQNFLRKIVPNLVKGKKDADR